MNLALHFAAAMSIITFGCNNPNTNPYTTFFQPRPGGVAVIGNDRYEAAVGEAVIYSYTSDLHQDEMRLMEDGFEKIGHSSFNGGGNGASKSNLLAQARAVGASVVLVKSGYSHTISGVMPYTIQNPGQIVTSRTSGTANAFGSGGNAIGTYSGTTTTYVPGGSTTYQQPYSIQRFDFFATYWIKIKTFRFGAYWDNLPQDVRIRLQRNTGVHLTLIVRRTPAFIANLLPGDIVLKVGDEDVIDKEHFSSLLGRADMTRPTKFQIQRGNETRLFEVQMKP